MERGVCILTGASRGFGRQVALQVARTFGNVHFVLVARDSAALNETGELIKAESKGCTVDTLPGDLGDMAALPSLLDRLVAKCAGQWQWALLVNNAGTLGDVSKLVQDYTLTDVRPFMDLNITSPVVLTSRFIKEVVPSAKKAQVVNVSSLMAVQAFGYSGLYCLTRAARDMLHAVVAKESNGNVRTLSYAPGPMDTDMQKECREQYGSEDLRTAFADMHAKGTLVDPAQSAAKLVNLLSTDKFESGSHVDFYDV